MYADPINEFLRQGCEFDKSGKPVIGLKKAVFKVYENRAYTLCGTYPSLLVFPVQADDECIVKSAEFRSARRLPSLTYFDKECGTSIWRCAQPGSSFFKRSNHDEALLRHIGMCNNNPKSNA